VVSTDDVKRALAVLATRTDTATRPYAAVIDEAHAARGDLVRAAGFVEAVGLDRLVDAIDDAERDGNPEAAARGREALEAYRRFRSAASGSGRSTASGSGRSTASGSGRSTASGSERPENGGEPPRNP
jgi:hypothetical protein